MPASHIDFRRELHALYAAGREPVLVDVPDLAFLMVEGRGDPSGPGFQEAVGALYSVAFGVKSMMKRAQDGVDFPVMPLEALWWTDTGTFPPEEPGAWKWTAMIMQPEPVTAEVVEAALERAAAKHVAGIERVACERFHEGPAAQVLHVGPYAAEGPTIARLHAFVAAQGLAPAGKHHEIYLGDPRRAAPEKLRTIVRQAVTPVPAA